MGSCCSSADNFNDAGAGRTLGSQPAQSQYGSLPSQTGSNASGNGAGSTTANPAQREEMRRAAEARQAAVRFPLISHSPRFQSHSLSSADTIRYDQASKRGVINEGKLSKSLNSQPADGGRVTDAIREGGNKSTPLVVSNSKRFVEED